MKTKFFLSGLLFMAIGLISITSCNKKDFSIVGTWEIDTVRIVNADSVLPLLYQASVQQFNTVVKAAEDTLKKYRDNNETAKADSFETQLNRYKEQMAQVLEESTFKERNIEDLNRLKGLKLTFKADSTFDDGSGMPGTWKISGDTLYTNTLMYAAQYVYKPIDDKTLELQTDVKVNDELTMQYILVLKKIAEEQEDNNEQKAAQEK